MTGLGVPIEDAVVKAAPGFGRGLGGGYHRYWKRTRKMVGGKLKWIYYYNDPKEQAKWAKRVDETLGTARKRLAELEAKLAAATSNEERAHVEAQIAEITRSLGGADHRAQADFGKDNPTLAAARKALSGMTIEYVSEILGWDTKITISPKVMAQYHDAVAQMYEADGEPYNLLGKPISPLRAMQLAFDRLPPVIKEHFPNLTSINWVTGDENKDLRAHPQYHGTCWYPSGKSKSTIDMAADRIAKFGGGGQARMKGGLWAVEVLIHEMGHSVHNQIGAKGHAIDAVDWKGKTFADFEAFLKGPGGKEPKITGYAGKNNYERWAESWTAALMFPHQLASTCPQMYDWFREFLGPGVMRPLHSDPAEMARLGALRDAAIAAGDAQRLGMADAALSDAEGILDMAATDRRLEWWRQPENRVQKLLRESRRLSESKGLFGDYAACYRAPSDKFYEMSVGGRTAYLRVGPSGPGAHYSGWDPGDPKGAAIKPRQGEIKEIYDEDGHPLTNKQAWWHLHQDEMTDDHPSVKLVSAGIDTDPATDKNGYNEVRRLQLHEQLVQVSRNTAGGSPEHAAKLPVPINEDEFRLRSGTFAYDRIDAAGHAELAALAKATNPGERDRLLAEYVKKQPGVMRDAVRDPRTGRMQKPRVRMAEVTPGGPLVPVMRELRYVNANPDGTTSTITVTRDESKSGGGRYFIASPAWRELLTPRGENIESAAHLSQLMLRAAQDKRKTWVSVKTDATGGDTPHYYHVEIEFDGRGQPRVLGDFWKQRLGKDNPRLDDLLSSGTLVDGSEAARPRIKADKIKLEAPTPRRFAALPDVGARVVMTAKGAEIGRKDNKDGVFVLAKVLPGKKAGEIPSPPGWDRMPDDVPPIPGPVDGKKFKLTAKEKALVKQGLLPEWYGSDVVSREWKQAHFDPAYAEWDRTKEDVKSEAWDPQYVFVAEAGGGVTGGTRVVVHGDKDAIKRIRHPITNRKPRPMEHDVLVYAHRTVDPVTGVTIEEEARILLPTDGRVTLARISELYGVTVVEDKTEGRYLKINLDGFARLREDLGAVSLTGEAEVMLSTLAEMLRDAALRATEQKHVIEVEDITPAKLAAGGAGLRTHFENGAPIVLAQHQRELVQTVMDNEGRALGAHFMGTGKTISAIVAAKAMIAMRDPDDSSKPHPNAPTKVLIVAPLNTVEQWRQAAERFDEGAHVVGGRTNDIPVDEFVAGVKSGQYGHNLAVCGPEYFTIHQKELREAGFDGIVVDEAHKGIKEKKALRNKAIGEWNDSMKMMFLLTGTPVTTSPADMLEYIKLLSKGEQWAGMTRGQFIDEYLEESPVPGAAGITGRKGPKVQVKASKRAELAAIISRWTHVAAPKDVKGKTLPAVRIGENRHAEMTGIQATLYAMQMAALSDAEKERLTVNGDTLSEDETAGLGDDAKKHVAAAKAIANCLAYKPQSDQPFVMTRKLVPVGGKMTTQSAKFVTLDPKRLFDKDIRKKMAGRWPTIDEIGEGDAHAYTAYLQDVIGVPYDQVAGLKITPEQLARMKADGWPRDIKNPEAGPVGIRCRGYDTPAAPHPDADAAFAFQREYANILVNGVPGVNAKGVPVQQKLSPEEAFFTAMHNRGVDNDIAMEFMTVRPDPTDHHRAIESWDRQTTVEEGASWTSDTRGSLHLLYRPEDWDIDTGKPRLAGPVAVIALPVDSKVEDKGTRNGALVEAIGKGALKPPPELQGADKKAWEPPMLRYDRAATLAAGDGRIAVVRADTGATTWLAPSDVQLRVASLMDPGMRAERRKADAAMTVGNAKTEELRTRIQQFHQDTGPGPNGARQMVLFANGILDGCRPVEATLREMGMMDVNEALAGSLNFDPGDPRVKTGAPTGKYFVTYIGATYTGDRDLNVEIFKKVKDRLDRDTPVSLFVDKCQEGRRWRAYPADDPHPSVRASQWTAEQRVQIQRQLGIRAPEAYYVDTTGPGDTSVAKYFYGTKRSAAILVEITLAGDPTRIVNPAQGEATRKQIASLKAEYEEICRKEAVTRPPLTTKQQAVFNNCEFIVCSDAAQVGMNLGNSSELVMYDSLGSPMAEWQRITRCARMLDPAVAKELRPWVEKIKSMEPSIFDPGRRGTGSEGILPAVRLASNLRMAATGESSLPRGDVPFGEALNAIAMRADALRVTATSDHRADDAQAWGGIAAKCRAAQALGTLKAVEIIAELRETKAPGSTENVLECGEPRYNDPLRGTYDEIDVEAPTRAVTTAIEALGVDAKAAFAKAGFTPPGAEGDRVGSLDATAIYLAIRADEILSHVEARRTVVAARMRSTPGGAVVTDADVTNTIIDELTPMDRAVLKTKKYLVNVDRIGVSAHVPQVVKNTPPKTDEESEHPAEPISVFVGYAKQHPITPEAMTRATGRARTIANDALMADIQAKVAPRVPLDYQSASAADVADMSRRDVRKSLVPAVPLGGSHAWR